MKADIDLLRLAPLIQSETTKLLKRHRRQVAANTVLPSSTPAQRDIALRGYSDEELLARAKRASPATIERMETRAVAVFAEAETSGVSVWTLVEERSGNYNSWYTFKAGVQRYLEDELAATKWQLDCWQRDVNAKGPSSSLESAGGSLVRRLAALSVALRQIPSGAPERFKSDGKTKRYAKHSKSVSIRTVDEDWRERVAGAMLGDLKLLFLLQCVTGCRPQELANGVQVRLRRDGTIVARVKGAKCDEVVGQPSRCLRLAKANGVTLMLARMLEVGHTLDSRKCDLGSVNTYAKRVARACARAFPERKERRRLSPYSARHQFKADLVAAGWSRVEVAMAMGHSTTRSGTAYGQGGRGGGGGVRPIAIKARRPVKLRGEYPQARTGPAANTLGGMPRRNKPRM
jgi:integrase